MARRSRATVVVPDRPHHLIIRGNNRRKLFSYCACRRRFLVLLTRASQIFECPVHVLVLMTNHVHLVVTPSEARALAAFMKHFEQRYAVERNRRFDSSGKLFEERYYADPIADESHFAAVTPYIELNPERAGLSSSAEVFPWSTYALHALGPERSVLPSELWTPSSWYLALGPDDERRRAAYREHFSHRRAAGDALGRAVRELESCSDVAGHRPRRPDGSKVREEQAPYRGLVPRISR